MTEATLSGLVKCFQFELFRTEDVWDFDLLGIQFFQSFNHWAFLGGPGTFQSEALGGGFTEGGPGLPLKRRPWESFKRRPWGAFRKEALESHQKGWPRAFKMEALERL